MRECAVVWTSETRPGQWNDTGPRRSPSLFEPRVRIGRPGWVSCPGAFAFRGLEGERAGVLRL
jgi:hypothetical protein